MNGRDMLQNDMDEPHYYPLLVTQKSDKEKLQRKRLNYRFDRLFYEDECLERSRYASLLQAVNEYGWMWLNRNGTPAFYQKPEPTRTIGCRKSAISNRSIPGRVMRNVTMVILNTFSAPEPQSGTDGISRLIIFNCKPKLCVPEDILQGYRDRVLPTLPPTKVIRAIGF